MKGERRRRVRTASLGPASRIPRRQQGVMMVEPGGLRNSADAPFFASGIPRSGTTWMQWSLCQHPQIHIHGQLPMFDWQAGWRWYRQLVGASVP